MMMKLKIINFVFFMSFFTSAFAQYWSWATELSSGGIVNSSSIVVSSGVTYVAGNFYDIQIFGSTVLDASDGEVYFCKISNDDGTILSVGQLAYYSPLFSFTVDNQGYLIFGLLESDGQSLGKLVKLDDNGNVAWQFSFTSLLGGSESYIRFQALTTDDAGNIYLSGISNGDIFYNNVPIMDGYNGFFVLKFNPFGTLQWVVFSESISSSFYAVHDIDVDNQGKVAVVGDFSGSVSWSNIQISSNGGYDAFIVMFDDAGNVLWAKNAGGSANSPTDVSDQGLGVALDNSGGVYVSGSFSGVAEFSPVIGLVSMGGEDVFIAKYDYDGNVIWATAAGGVSRDQANDIAVNQYGETFITGFYGDNPATFGGITLEASSVPNVDSNIFIAKCSEDGDFVFADNAISYASSSSEPDNMGKFIYVDNEGGCYVTGDYISHIDFGSISLGTPTTSGIHPFISKYTHSITQIEQFSRSANDFSLFPNPSCGNIVINSNKSIAEFAISVFDCRGKNVYNNRTSIGQIEITGLDSGLYFIKVFDGELVQIMCAIVK